MFEEIIEVAQTVIPFEKFYKDALDALYIDIPSVDSIEDLVRDGMQPEYAYAEYLQTLVDNLENVDGRIEAVLYDIEQKLSSGELQKTPELEKLIHELTHPRIEVIERVKIGPDRDDWITFEPGMEIRKDDDEITRLYAKDGTTIGTVGATDSRLIDQGGLREQLDSLKREIRNTPVSELFDEEKDLRPYGLTRESFAEFNKENPDPIIIEKLRRAMGYEPEKLDRYHDRILALLNSIEQRSMRSV